MKDASKQEALLSTMQQRYVLIEKFASRMPNNIRVI
jgi:hypothetical protein